jgi:lipopolysaccharide/colanic/teichoic acid biosynthesis glycosyltransferase
MSIIGPRPERIDIVEEYNQKHHFYKYRHLVKPGITGWAQVNKPLATPDQNLEKLEYDLYYINNHSLGLDVKILAKTVGVVKNLESL